MIFPLTFAVYFLSSKRMLLTKPCLLLFSRNKRIACKAEKEMMQFAVSYVKVLMRSYVFAVKHVTFT